MEVAMKASLNVIRQNARLILIDHYQTTPKSEWETQRTGLLYKAFRAHVVTVGDGVSIGNLRNSAQEGLWLDQGTKAHWVAPRNADVMAWRVSSDDWRYSKGHMISGIEALHFMSEALIEAYNLSSS